MKYYIIEQQAGKLEISKVNPVDEANFLEDYGRYVIAQGNSIMEALLAFEELKHQKARQ